MRATALGMLLVPLALAALAPRAAAQSVQVLGSGEDARRCSSAAEFAASLRSASREDLEHCLRALDYGSLRTRDRAGTLVNKGIIESALGDQQAAMASYDKAIAIVPELPEPWVGRGNVLFITGKPAAAIPEYTRSIELGIVRRHIALLNRGMAEEALGNLDAAERDYRAALEFSPEWPLALSRIERVLAKRKAAAEGKTAPAPAGAGAPPR